MQREWAERWVAALISEKYIQTRHCLHNATGYDPIGVLADISGLGYYAYDPFEAGQDLQPRGFLLFDTGENAPPTIIGQLQELVGISFYSIGLVAEMNDRGASFKEIAAYIGQHWETM